MPYTDLEKLQKIEKLVFSLHIKPSTSSVTLPEVDVFIIFDFYLYYKWNVSVINFTWQIDQIQSVKSLLNSLYHAETSSEFAGPSLHYCARVTQLLAKKWCSGGEPLTTVYPIWEARDLNFRPPALETKALSLVR